MDLKMKSSNEGKESHTINIKKNTFTRPGKRSNINPFDPTRKRKRDFDWIWDNSSVSASQLIPAQDMVLEVEYEDKVVIYDVVALALANNGEILPVVWNEDEQSFTLARESIFVGSEDIRLKSTGPAFSTKLVREKGKESEE